MDDVATSLVCQLVVMVICAAITGTIAHFKGRNVLGWTLLGLLGLIPLIIVACLPNVKEQQERDAYQAEENRRLREQLRQERIKGEAFRQHAAARLDAHDQHLGIDTRTMGPTLGAGATAGELGAGTASDPGLSGGPNLTDPRWYYGQQGRTIGPVKALEIAGLIRQQIITRDTLLWSEDMADWLPAGDVAAFAGQFG
jgi:GYF domain 2